MQEKEYIQYQLKKMARAMDRTPTQEEFTSIVRRYWVKKCFGTYNNLLESVGLEPNKVGVGREKQ